MSITNLDARLWQVEVALVARKLLSLGRAYTARYSLPRDVIEEELTFRDFGLDIAAIASSHVFQVAETTGEPFRFPPEFTGEFTEKDPVRSIQVADYLVGMGVEDFLVCPRSLELVEQDVAAIGAEVVIKHETGASTEKTVVFHFVRMGECVRDDPRPPGSTLRTLDEVDASCAQLLTRYELLSAQKQLADEELQCAKELLAYVNVTSCETRKFVMEDEKFQFAAKYREWYVEIRSGLESSADSTALDSTQESSEHEVCHDDPCIQCQWRIIWIPCCSTMPSSPSTDRVEVADNSVLETRLSDSGETRGAICQLESTSDQLQEKRQDEVTTGALVPNYGVADGRSYLFALVSPATDIVASLEQLTIHVQNAPLLARNNEFIVAAGLKVRREIRRVGQSLFAARVRLGHLSFKFTAATGRDAAIGALLRLTRAVIEHRRLYGEMLSYLETHFGFCMDNDGQAVKDAALMYLVEKKIVLFREVPSGEPGNTVYDVVACIQEFPLICRRGSSLSSTKAEVVDALMLFLLELVEEYQMSLKVDRVERIINAEQVEYTEAVSYGDSDDFCDRIEKVDSRNAELKSEATLRKRPLSPQKPGESCESERDALRPRLSYAAIAPKTRMFSEANEPTMKTSTESSSQNTEPIHQKETTAVQCLESSDVDQLRPSAQVNDNNADPCSDDGDEDNGCNATDEESDELAVSEEDATFKREKESRYVEPTDSDDDKAKFRAMIRSLLAFTDEFRTGVNKLRGATNCAVQATIFPSIRASINRTRLKGSITFSVNVNDVLHFKASKVGKFAACNAAIDGILIELDKTRLAWTQLLEILHDKSLQGVPPVECYRALKRSRVASIKTTVEDSTHPSRIRCAVQVNGHVLCRATSETKAKARRSAELRAVQFFYSLVDCLQSLEFSYKTITASGRIDWSCRIELQDADDASRYHKFRVEAVWCRPRIGMKPEGFPSQGIVATQQGTVPMERVETELLSLHESALACFSLMLPSSDPSEHRKFVRQLVPYSELWGHEPHALLLTISPQCPYTIYLIPPGTTISSELDEALPRLDYRKSVVGILTKKTLDNCVSTLK